MKRKRVELKAYSLSQRFIDYIVKIEDEGTIREIEITLPRKMRALRQFKRLLTLLGCEVITPNPYAKEPEA